MAPWADLVADEMYQAFYKKDYSIFSIGSPVLGLFFVQSGLVKEFILRPNSEVDIVRFAGEGEVVGNAGNDSKYYLFGADAKTDAVVCFFRNEMLKSMYETNPRLLYDLMMFYANENSEITYRLLNLSQMNLREKIASVLYDLFLNFGTNKERELMDCFNRDDIANLARTTSEQVSRQLSDFQKEGIIDKRGRKIAILDVLKMKNIIKDYLNVYANACSEQI